MKRGEIYYVENDNKSVGCEIHSGRPALIVSNDKNNEHSGTVEVVYMTTQPKKYLPTHVFVRCRNLDGKYVNSTILCEQIYTIDKSRIGNAFCVMEEDSMKKVDRALAVSLGLNVEKPEAKELDIADKMSKMECKFYKERYEELLEILKRK